MSKCYNMSRFRKILDLSLKNVVLVEAEKVDPVFLNQTQFHMEVNGRSYFYEYNGRGYPKLVSWPDANVRKTVVG